MSSWNEPLNKRLVRRIALIAVVALIPFIRFPYAIWYWVMDTVDCYEHWWKELKAGEPVDWP